MMHLDLLTHCDATTTFDALFQIDRQRHAAEPGEGASIVAAVASCAGNCLDNSLFTDKQAAHKNCSHDAVIFVLFAKRDSALNHP